MDVVSRRRFTSGLVLTGPEELEVRALRGDEGQRSVIVHCQMEDDRADRPRAVAAPFADAALGVQHEPFLRADWQRLAEDVPLTGRDRLRLPAAAGVFGKVQGKPARDLRAPAVVQLDRRRQPIAREDRLAPDEERVLGIRRRGAIRLADEPRQPGEGVDLTLRFLQPVEERRGVVLGLNRITGDEPLDRELGKEVERRVKQHRRHEERGEESKIRAAMVAWRYQTSTRRARSAATAQAIADRNSPTTGRSHRPSRR